MKKIFRVALIGFSILVALIILLQIFASMLLPNMIRHRISSEVDRASRGLYALSIDKVTVDIFQMSVGIHHAQLNFQVKDTAYINSYPHPLWKGTIDHAQIAGINLLEFFMNKKIVVANIILTGSDIEMIRPAHFTAVNDSSVQQLDSVPRNFPSIKIGSLITRNTSFRILNLLHDTLPSFQTKDIEIAMKDIAVDSTILFSRHQLFDAAMATATIKKIQYITPDSLFKLSIPKIQFSYNNEGVIIDSLQFTPRYDRKEFLEKIPIEKDYMTISVNEIKLEKANIKRLLENKECLVQKMIIDSMRIYSYRDKNISDNKTIKPMPQELLYKCPFLLSIDSLFIKDASATYQERTCSANEAGKVWFNDINGVITNVTNDSVNSRRDTLKIVANALLMGEGKIDATFLFPLFDPMLRFYSHGTVGAMNIVRLNPMLEKNAFVSAQSGNIKAVEYTMNGDKVKSTGSVKMIYDNLKITKVSKDDKNGSSIINKAVTLIASLVVKNKSATPESQGDPQSMEWRRDPTRSIFNYVWKTLLSGIKKTVGLPSNKKTTIGETTCP